MLLSTQGPPLPAVEETNASEKVMVKNTQRLWSVFRLLTFVNSLFSGIVGPLEVIFFLSIGFNAAQIGALFAVQGLGTFISEIPTGAFADRYGRKKSLIISFAILTVVLTVWATAHNFFVFLLLSFLWGVGFTFQSGVKVALLIDHLSLSTDDKRRTRAFARLAVYGNIGLFLGGLAAAAIALHSLRLIWVAAAVLQVVLVIITWLGLNEMKAESTTTRPSARLILLDSLRGIRSYFTVMPFPLLLILEGATTFILSAYIIVIPLFLRQTWHVTNAQFGLLGSLAAASGIIGALLGERLHRRRGFLTTSALFALVLIGLFIGVATSHNVVTVIAAYALIELFLFGWDPIEQSLVNRFLPSNNRSVMLSVSSSTNLAIRSMSQVLVGILLLILQPRSLISILGCVFLVWPIITSILVRFRKKGIQNQETFFGVS